MYHIGGYPDSVSYKRNLWLCSSSTTSCFFSVVDVDLFLLLLQLLLQLRNEHVVKHWTSFVVPHFYNSLLPLLHLGQILLPSRSS